MASKNKLYIGNLSFDCSNEDLMDLFKQAGGVEEAALITDRFTGRSRGFAFVTMVTEEEALRAIELFHDQDFLGRKLVVREAYDAAEKKDFGGGARRPHSGGERSGGGERRGGFNKDRGGRSHSSGPRGGKGGYGGGGHRGGN